MTEAVQQSGFLKIRTWLTGRTRSPLRIGVFCHIFYADLAEEIFAHLANIPGHVDILISTDSVAKAETVWSTFAGWDRGKVQIEALANRGRDIGPRMTFYRDHHHRYDLVLYLHTKRGKFVVDGEAWRQYLFGNLVGSPAIVGRIISAFGSNPDLGLLFPQHWPPIAPFIGWGGNIESATALAVRLGSPASLGQTIDFPSGSMFWCRPAALRPLLDLNLSIDDFEPELGQLDGTLAHAIERMFLISCGCAGYRWRQGEARPGKVIGKLLGRLRFAVEARGRVMKRISRGSDAIAD